MARLINPAGRWLKSISSLPSLKTEKWIRRGIVTHTQFTSYDETLLNFPTTQVTVLDNGLRVATEDSGSPTATVGLYIQTGSRFESEENNGVAHFFEHLAFKGTNKRSRTDLELEVENLGAHLNAHTSREQTAFYVKCFSQDVPKAVEILSDIVQNSKLEESEIEKARGVILKEIDAIENNLKEVCFDHLHSVAFQGTPLGRTILGPVQNVKSLTKQDLKNYVINNYKAPRIVLAGAGGVDHQMLVHSAEEHFKTLQGNLSDAFTVEPCRFTGSEVRVRDDALELCHIAIAVEGIGWNDRDYIPLMVANNIIGSWDATHGGRDYCASRLGQAAFEGNLCRSFQSFNTSYNDTGLWGIHFTCEKLTQDDFVFNLQNFWMHMCTSVSDMEVERAKNTLKTNLLLQLDGTTQVCEDIGRQMLNHGRRIPLHELDANIDAVTTDVVRDACYRNIYDKCIAIAAVGPCENLTNYNRIRSGMYWLRV